MWQSYEPIYERWKWLQAFAHCIGERNPTKNTATKSQNIENIKFLSMLCYFLETFNKSYILGFRNIISIGHILLMTNIDRTALIESSRKPDKYSTSRRNYKEYFETISRAPHNASKISVSLFPFYGRLS